MAVTNTFATGPSLTIRLTKTFVRGMRLEGDLMDVSLLGVALKGKLKGEVGGYPAACGRLRLDPSTFGHP